MNTRRLSLVEEQPGAAAPVLRVAIATRDRKKLDAHFGSAPQFAVYEVTPAAARLVAVCSFSAVSEETGAHAKEGEDRIGPKVEALRGCHLLFVLAIGGPAAAQVVRARIHPVKLQAPEEIESILARVQQLMLGRPPPWLRKAMKAAGSVSLADLEDDAAAEARP
jgi:nitrogen fixation protein NifX